MSAAFIFAAQMVNFPVAFGTSGHLIGSVLAAVLLGPGPAVIVMSTVLLVQCLIFADGGLFALGANVFNMAIVGTLTGYWIFRFLIRMFHRSRGRIVAIVIASWCSVVLASLCCAGELAWSGAAPAAAVIPAMAGVHALIGIGEGLITAAVYVAIEQARPDLLEQNFVQGGSVSVLPFALLGCIVALGLVLFVSPFASHWPDGFNSVAKRLGFDQGEVNNPLSVPLTGSWSAWLTGPPVATIIGGIIGLMLVFVLTIGLVRVLTSKSSRNAPSPKDHSP